MGTISVNIKAIDFEATRLNNGFKVNPSDLVINWDDNGREETTITDEFVQSILGGQEQPCKVRPITVQGGVKKWKLVFGYRRAKAALHINEKGLTPEPFLLWVVVDEAINDEGAFLANIRENLVRQDCTVLDHAKNISRLKELYTWTDERIAAHYGKTGAWVSKTRKVAQLDEKFRKLIRGKVITAAQAEKLVDCDEAFRDQIYEQIKADGLCKFSASDIVAKAREEGATATNRDNSLKPKAIKEFFEKLATPDEGEEVPAYVSEFAAVALKWLKGQRNMGDTKFYTELEYRLKKKLD